MLTPKHRALFAAAYSALLLHTPRAEGEEQPGTSEGEATRPEPGPADGGTEQRRSA